MLDLSLPKLLILGVLALMIFGPDQLPRMASQAGRALRDLRRLAENARNDLQEGLGPEFQNFDVADLNPRNFVRKHLFDDIDDDDPTVAVVAGAAANGTAHAAANGSTGGLGGAPTQTLAPGEQPPYEAEAT